MTHLNRTTVNANAGMWEGLYHATLRSEFARSEYRGLIRPAYHAAEISTGGLGEWHWERMFPSSATNKTEYVVLTVLHNPIPKHHGMISYQAAIAHMLVHIEHGTQCSAWEPINWSGHCKAVEYEAMNRMGWYPGNCDTYDSTIGGMVGSVPNNILGNA